MKKLSIFLALLVLSFYSFAQVRTITGVVTSAEDKEPLIQVVVQVKGTQTAVVTDMDGKYTVKVQSPEAVLSGA